MGVFVPTDSRPDTAHVPVIAQTIFSNLEMSGFQAREDTAFVAHHYSHNHNHRQIYILSAQGAAANNSILHPGCHKDIEKQQKTHWLFAALHLFFLSLCLCLSCSDNQVYL